MPIGILGSLIICTVLYMATAAVLTGVVSFTKLNVAAPVATAVDTFGPQWGWLAKCIKIGAIAGLSSVVLVLMFGQTRVFYSMSRDGLLPKTLAQGASEVQDALDQHAHRRRAGVAGRRGLRHQPARRPDLGGNAGGLRPGVFLGDLAALQAARSAAPLQGAGAIPVIPAHRRLLCFVLAWIGVEHAHPLWFFWFMRRDRGAVLRLRPYWESPMRNQAPEAADAAR